MKKVMIPLANGFEEIEFTTIVDVLRRGDLEVIITSLTDDLKVTGAHKIEVMAEKTLKNVSKESFDAIVLPGGMPGTTNLLESSELKDIINTHFKNSKLIGAICAAPWVLNDAGILSEKTATIYPGMDDKIKSANYISQKVVEDENIITGQAPGAAMEFALKLIEKLVNKEKSSEIKTALVY
jgi:protein deglycase